VGLSPGVKLAAGGIAACAIGWYLWGKLFPADGQIVGGNAQAPVSTRPAASHTAVNVAWASPPASARVPSAPTWRHLTGWEQAVLGVYFRSDFLTQVTLHIGQWQKQFDSITAPSTQAVTDSSGQVWFKDPNVIFSSPDAMATLAHEIVHVAQRATGLTDAQYAQAVAASRSDPASNVFEAPAYALELQVLDDLNAIRSSP
jgi:hypothetical protein